MAGATALHVPFTTSPPGIATQNSILSAQPMYAFFGTPETTQPLRSYSDVNQTIRTFPEALRGQSRFLETTFTLLALTNNAFMTTVILPLEYTNDTSYTWTEWIFHPYLPEQVPHLGIVRYVQSKTTPRSKTLTRRGLGLTLEHGFMETELGRQTYVMEVRQIAQAINEGLQLEAMFALMTAQKNELERLRQLNGNGSSVHNAHVDAIIQREIDTWAFIQQKRQAWMALDDYVERAIETYARGGFKAWIVDIRVESFRKRTAQDQTRFDLRGPGFIESMQQGAQYYSVDELGNVVYATRSFLVDENQPINPLESTAQIGEYFRCADVPDMNFSKYDSSFRTQLFYDEDADVMKPCTLKDKVANCGRFRPDGTLRTFADLRVANLNDLEDQKRDFLHYEKPSGELAPLSLFGQLKQQHFTESDYHDLARTVFASLNTNSYEWREYEKAFSTITKYLQIVDRIPYDAKYEAWVVALTAWNRNEASGNTGGNAFPAANGVGDIRSNTMGSLDMFNDGQDYGFNARWQILPPTHATYGGFKTIQSMYENNNGLYGNAFDMNAAKDIAAAMTVFDDFVAKVAMFFPKSLAASATWVSPNIHNPTAHDAVFENLLCRQFPSRPIFARPLFGVTTNIAAQVGALANAQTPGDITTAVDAIRNAISGELNLLRTAAPEESFDTIQHSLRLLFNSVTGPLELLNRNQQGSFQTGAGTSAAVSTGQRANIGLKISSNADADSINIVSVPGSSLTPKATTLSAALGPANVNRLKLWMMTPTDTYAAAAVKAKILLWIAFVNTTDLTQSNARDIARRFIEVLDALDNKFGDITAIADEAAYSTALVTNGSDLTDLIDTSIKNNPDSYSSPKTAAVGKVLNQIDATLATLSQTAVPATSAYGDYPDVQNFRPAPIRIGRTAFVTYVNNRSVGSKRFVPGSGNNVFAPMTRQELADSSSYPIWKSTYAEVGDEADKLVNLPLVKNAKALLLNGSLPSRPSLSGVDDFPSGVRRLGGMPSINMGPSLKRARHDSNIVGGSQTPDMSTQYVEPPDFTTDNVDDVLPQHMKDVFSSLCATFNGQLGVQLVSFIFMFTPVTRQALEATINYNLLHPFDYIIARPHATYRTVASIKMKPGSETGNTLFGNMQVTVGDDTTVQVVQAAVRFYQGALIKKPDNIFVVRNSMVVGYHGGLGSGFIKPGSRSYNPSIGLFGEGPDASIIVIAIPRHERLTGSALSLSGALTAVDPTGRIDTISSTAHRQTYNTVAYYRRLYLWFTTQANNPDYMVNVPGLGDIVPNTIVFSSTAIYRDPKTGQWNMGTANLGHWRTHTVGANMHNARIGKDSFNLEAQVKPFQIDFSF